MKKLNSFMKACFILDDLSCGTCEDEAVAIDELYKLFGLGDDVTKYVILEKAIEMRLVDFLRPRLKLILQTDKSSLMRHEAAFGMGVLRDPEFEEPLIKALRSDAESGVRHEAAIALAQFGTDKCLQALKDALYGDVFVRESAAVALQCVSLRRELRE